MKSMSLSSGRKSPLTAEPKTSRRLTWWRWQRFLICRLRVATNGIIFRRRDFSRTWLVGALFFEHCGCLFEQRGQFFLNEVPDLAFFHEVIGFKRFAPTEGASVTADASSGRIVVDDKASQSAADFVDLPFDCGSQDPIGGVVVESLSVGELEDGLGGLLDLPDVHFVVTGHGFAPGNYRPMRGSMGFRLLCLRQDRLSVRRLIGGR